MDVADIAGRLTKAQRDALLTLPLPGWKADRVWFGRGAVVPYSSTWRKSSKHWDAMLQLEEAGLVEQKQSRGETLWRPTKPDGLAVRAHIQGNSHD